MEREALLGSTRRCDRSPSPTESASGQTRKWRAVRGESALTLPAQRVDATRALNLSAGVSNCKVSRGRSFSCRATLFRWACECTDKSVPFGKYCLSRPLVFSFDPRCHGLCGSQKYTSILVANVKRR